MQCSIDMAASFHGKCVERGDEQGGFLRVIHVPDQVAEPVNHGDQNTIALFRFLSDDVMHDVPPAGTFGDPLDRKQRSEELQRKEDLLDDDLPDG